MVAENVPLGASDYVTILKCKASERDATASCQRDNVIPLFEVRDPTAAAQDLLRARPASSGVLWVHGLNLDGMDEASFATSMSELFALLHPATQAVPVITTDESAGLLRAVRAIVAEQGRGLVLRIDVEEVLRLSGSLHAAVDAALSACAVTPSAVDMIIDAGLLNGTRVAQATLVGHALDALSHVRDWRSLVVAGSAFPPEMNVVDKDTVGEFARDDAATFDLVASSYTPRRLTYADYTIGVPTYNDVSHPPIPNIKYTHERVWKVHRAHERENPSPQYQALAADLAGAPYFASASFSPGDRYISAVASGFDGPGNATTYLRAGISHHVHVVADRLATLGVP